MPSLLTSVEIPRSCLSLEELTIIMSLNLLKFQTTATVTVEGLVC